MKIFLLSAACFLSLNAWAQTESDAMQWARQGMDLVSQGKYDEGIELLKKARNQMPGNYEFTLEIGRAHLLEGKPQKAEKFLFPLQYHADVDPDLFQTLGECYLGLKKKKQALETFRLGVEKFQNEGALYAGLGRAYVASDSLERALAVFEMGINKAPKFAYNYLYAAKLLGEKESFWAWVYAETFLNLSTDNAPRKEAALLVFRNLRALGRSKNAPQSTDQFVQKWSAAAQTCRQDDATLAAMGQVYACLAKELSGQTHGIAALWADVAANGQMQAYVHHTLGEADKDEFTKWVTANSAQYARFVDWLQWNGLEARTIKPLSRVKH